MRIINDETEHRLMDPLLIMLVSLSSVLGGMFGLLTGLIPGIHVNTLASILLISYPMLETLLSGTVPNEYVPIVVCSIIMSASVVHSYVDFVPSVFIGAPDAEDAISVLPGHRLLLSGQGMRAVRAAAIGSLIGCSVAILMAIPMQMVMTDDVTHYLDRITKIILAVVSGIIILNEYRKGHLIFAIIVFILSGVLGYAVMNLPIPCEGLLGEGTLLMPMLTGLFGLPVMLESASGHPFPRQTDDGKDPVGLVPGLKGVIMGSVAGWFPGITSTVGATVSTTIMPDRTPERFISTVASIGTVTTVLSLVTLSISGGGRSGR
jgi:putative membrane protein